MCMSIGSVPLAALLASGNAAAITRNYSLPDTLTGKRNQGDLFSYGAPGARVDYALDGRTIAFHSIRVTAQGEQTNPDSGEISLLMPPELNTTPWVGVS